MDASTPARSVPVIQLSNVSVGSLRDAHLAVMRNVNWTVAPGEFWVIGGMQGTGKTDLLLMLAGLQSLPQDIYEAARLEDASGWTQFWTITFPLLLPLSVAVVTR